MDMEGTAFWLGGRKLCVCIWPWELWGRSTNARLGAGEPVTVCKVALVWLRCLVVEEHIGIIACSSVHGYYLQLSISCFKVVSSLLPCSWVSGGIELLKDTFCLWTGTSQQCWCFVCTDYSGVWLSVWWSWCRALVTSSAFLPLLICFEADEIICRTPKCFRKNCGPKILVLRVCLGSCDFWNTSAQNNSSRSVDLLIFDFHIFFLTSLPGVV